MIILLATLKMMSESIKASTSMPGAVIPGKRQEEGMDQGQNPSYFLKKTER
jgi:hypothetical protein